MRLSTMRVLLDGVLRAPNELNVMMTNVENNGAPWPFNQQDRLAWREELNT